MLAACYAMYAMSHPPSIEMGDIFFLVIWLALLTFPRGFPCRGFP